MNTLTGRGLGVTSAKDFADEPSSMIHEQLARLRFAEQKLLVDGGRILDFGCGTGYNCFYLTRERQPRQVLGVDILEECIRHCRDNYAGDNLEYRVQDCLEFNSDLGRFDSVISCEVLEHVDRQDLFLRNIRDYLKPGGRAFVSTPNRSLFSLSKECSFLNPTHRKELFYREFVDLLEATFGQVEMYSQCHSDEWHDAYMDYLCAANLAARMRMPFREGSPAWRMARWFSRVFYAPLIFGGQARDVRQRRYTDFEFTPGYHDRAVWFVAVCES